MKKYLRLWVAACFFVAMMGQDGLAQDPFEEGGFFEAIKEEMISSVEENKRLTEMNQTLKARLVSLQLAVEQYEEDVKALDWEYVTPYEQSLENISEDDILIQEAQNIYLSGQSMDLDEQQRLEELLLYDLRYEKQELQMDLEFEETKYQKIEEKWRPELDALRRGIQENMVKKKDLFVRIAEQQRAALVYPQDIGLLKMENEGLKQKIKMLKRLLSK